MFEKILVGYAGDRAGRDAVALAARLASVSGGELIVVYPYHPLLSTVSGEVAEERVRGELGALLDDDQLASSARYHWSSSSWPIRALHELAAYDACDLIVLGAARERLERRHVSLMERMLHGAPCAVAAAPRDYAARRRPPARQAQGARQAGGGFPRVGVGFSDSQEGRAAIALAKEIAQRGGATLRIIAGSGLSPSLASYGFSSSSLPAIEDQMHADTEATLERVARELHLGERSRLEVRRGEPGRVLSDASDELDLLVLGSRAYGPARHALLGSVSAYVMRNARCPVLVVPRGAASAADPLRDDARAVSAGSQSSRAEPTFTP
jgi:nucleotide-binding universal stress UspA family protein